MRTGFHWLSGWATHLQDKTNEARREDGSDTPWKSDRWIRVNEGDDSTGERKRLPNWTMTDTEQTQTQTYTQT